MDAIGGVVVHTFCCMRRCRVAFCHFDFTGAIVRCVVCAQYEGQALSKQQMWASLLCCMRHYFGRDTRPDLAGSVVAADREQSSEELATQACELF